MSHSERFLKIVDESKARIQEITPEETAAKLERGDDMLLIDTREDSEWTRGRIKGAVHVGKGVIERDIEKVAPEVDREIVLYCGGGFRSALAADVLQQMGYTNVKSMSGGWRTWNELGLPTES
jgi:rhodanese-related sulfurtransferase